MGFESSCVNFLVFSVIFYWETSYKAVGSMFILCLKSLLKKNNSVTLNIFLNFKSNGSIPRINQIILLNWKIFSENQVIYEQSLHKHNKILFQNFLLQKALKNSQKFYSLNKISIPIPTTLNWSFDNVREILSNFMQNIWN